MRLKNTLLAAVIGLSAVGTAQANQLWNWSYNGVGITAGGTLTTAGSAVSFEDVLSITGMRNGVAIVGLVPLDEDPDFGYDNQIRATGPYLTSGGLVLDLGVNEPHYNVYFFQGVYTEIVGPDFDEITVNFALTPAPVPEPSTALAMMAGLGLLGVYVRKGRSAA